MSRFLDGLVRHADGLLLVLSVVLGLWLFYLLLLVAPLKPNMAWAQLALNPHRFWTVLAHWGDGGLSLYRAHFAYDHVLALLYGAWGALMVARSGLFNRVGTRWRWLAAALLPAAALFDLLENAMHLYLLGLPEAASVAAVAILAVAPAPPGAWQVPLAGGFSLCKWLLILAFAGWLVWRALRRWWPVWAPELELRVPPLVVLVVFAAAMIWADQALPEWRVTWRGPLVWAATGLLVLAGAAMALVGVQAFQRANTCVNPMTPEATSHLVATGIYLRTRNPMYLGMALVQTGGAIWLSHPLAGLMVPLFMLYLDRFQVVPEERAMAARFGPAFRLYCEQVPRWL